LASEKYLRDYQSQYDSETVSLRDVNVDGPRPHQGAVPVQIRSGLNQTGLWVTIFTCDIRVCERCRPSHHLSGPPLDGVIGTDGAAVCVPARTPGADRRPPPILCDAPSS